MTEPSPLRNAARAGAVFAAALVPLIVGIEVLLRTFFIAPDFKYEDPELGPMNRAHARVVFSQEGWSVHRTNAFGFFSPEVRNERPALRVLVLGSSFTEALQVAPDESFAAVAERRLPGSEFVNAGQSGWSPAPALGLLRRVGPALDPDVVVLQVSEVNPFDPSTTHVEVDARGGFRLAPPVPRSATELRLRLLTDSISRHSALVTMLLQRVNQVQLEQRTRLAAKFGDGVRANAAAERDLSHERAALGWVLGEIHAASRALLLLYVPLLEYGVGRCESRSRPDTDALRGIAASHGLELIDPAPDLCADYLRTGQPLHGFHNSVMGEGHLNARGHEILGERLAAAIGALPR